MVLHQLVLPPPQPPRCGRWRVLRGWGQIGACSSFRFITRQRFLCSFADWIRQPFANYAAIGSLLPWGRAGVRAADNSQCDKKIKFIGLRSFLANPTYALITC